MSGHDNHWVAYRDPAATWTITLPASTPEAGLRWWLEAAVAALEATPLARIDQAPEIAYRRDRDGGLWPHLRALGERTGTVDLFSFERYRASGSVAWFEDDPVPVRGLVDDLGGLLERLRPHDVEAAGAGFMIHLPPVVVRGPRVGAGAARHPIVVRVRVHSDIWLPWVPGYLDDEFESGGHFDNRALARLHTPDLNALLVQLGDQAAELGGALALDEDATYAVLRGQVGDRGVLLDAPAPGPVH